MSTVFFKPSVLENSEYDWA